MPVGTPMPMEEVRATSGGPISQAMPLSELRDWQIDNICPSCGGDLYDEEYTDRKICPVCGKPEVTQVMTPEEAEADRKRRFPVMDPKDVKTGPCPNWSNFTIPLVQQMVVASDAPPKLTSKMDRKSRKDVLDALGVE